MAKFPLTIKRADQPRDRFQDRMERILSTPSTAPARAEKVPAPKPRVPFGRTTNEAKGFHIFRSN